MKKLFAIIICLIISTFAFSACAKDDNSKLLDSIAALEQQVENLESCGCTDWQESVTQLENELKDARVEENKLFNKILQLEQDLEDAKAEVKAGEERLEESDERLLEKIEEVEKQLQNLSSYVAWLLSTRN